MRLIPTCLVLCVVGTPPLIFGCGGAIASGEHGGDDGGPAQDAPTSTVTPPPTGTVDAGPVDATPPPYDAPVTIYDGGYCLVDLEPCITSAQCCSDVCNASGVCGPSIGPPPSREPDGYLCQSGAQCCTGSCFSGTCGGVTINDAGACYPDGYGCMTYLDCCSGSCAGGICGGFVFDSGPTCSPDGFGCQSYTDCCSNVCAFGVCGEPNTIDAGPPPPMCFPPGPTGCDACFASACCPELGACEADPTCSTALSCFTACYVPGAGNAASCSSKCGQQNPSAAGNALNQCAANACVPSCN